MPQLPRKPNQFELTGDNVQIIYSTTNLVGQPNFSYNDRTFTGNEIRTQKSELGTLVTVLCSLAQITL